jgi:Protein of unknown function (DUF2608)
MHHHPPPPFVIKEIRSIAEARGTVDALAGAGQRVLVLCDIDNTLLTMPRFVGSDEWFRWQMGLISAGASFAAGRVAVDRDHLCSLLSEAYDGSTPVPCEGKETQEFVRRVEKDHPLCTLVYVTARSESTRPATIRHLQAVSSTATTTVIMCNGQKKSACILSAFEENNGTTIPEASSYDQVVFIDDCMNNVVDVAVNLSRSRVCGFGITCLYYNPSGHIVHNTKRV